MAAYNGYTVLRICYFLPTCNLEIMFNLLHMSTSHSEHFNLYPCARAKSLPWW